MVCIAAGRLIAKSVLITFDRPLWSILLKNRAQPHYRLVVIVSDTETQAESFTVGIRTELAFNKRIQHDFGTQRTMTWAVGQFRTKNGCLVLARGKAQPLPPQGPFGTNLHDFGPGRGF